MKTITLSAFVLSSFFLASLVHAQVDWKELGPAPMSSGPYTGRVAAIATSKTKGDLYYIGAADGGVWRSSNGGSSWTPIGDQLPTTAVGALAVDPKDDRILYVGMGEANFANHSRYGLGLAKTVDGGASWKIYGRESFAGRCFSRIVIDPKNPRTLYASITQAGGMPAKSAARGHPGVNGPLGIFKSTNGGENWTQLSSGIPTNLSATDVAIDPSSPSILYAAFGHIFGDSRNGVYKSVDAGKSFTKLAGGLPTTSVGRVTLAIAPSRSTRLFASFVRAASSTGGGASTLGVYRTDNSGQNWTSYYPGSYQATYGWYLCTSIVHPTNPDIFFVGGLTARRTTNGGSSWSTVTPPHVDLHAYDFDANGRLLVGDDGGLHRSTNLGSSWVALNKFGAIQIYAGISLNPNVRHEIYCGLQDNGSVRRESSGSWTRVFGGDGGCTGVDSTGTRAFVEYQGTGNLFRSINRSSFRSSSSGISRGDRNCFLPPFKIHPKNGTHMLYGTQRLYESTNGGSSWSVISGDLTGGSPAAIRGIGWAPSDPKYVYTISNDGVVQASVDGGRSFTRSLTGIPGWPRVTDPFAIDPKDPKRVYLAVGAFGRDQILFSVDAGKNWVSLDGDLPDLPVHCLALDTSKGTPNIIYAGTENAVWRSVDHGKTWTYYGRGLAAAPVIDLVVDVPNGRIVAATQGRGVWEGELAPRGQRRRLKTK